jgi:hypothetical protein
MVGKYTEKREDVRGVEYYAVICEETGRVEKTFYDKEHKIKDQDALYVESWLLNEWGDIIWIMDKFKQEHGWKDSRINAAFYLVFKQSEQVGW